LRTAGFAAFVGPNACRLNEAIKIFSEPELELDPTGAAEPSQEARSKIATKIAKRK
jgi:hypothetical protein